MHHATCMEGCWRVQLGLWEIRTHGIFNFLCFCDAVGEVQGRTQARQVFTTGYSPVISFLFF